MTRLHVATLLLTLTLGCEESGPEWGHVSMGPWCGADSQAKRAEFVVRCAEAANPKSDEEGEDLVKECAEQAEVIYCTHRPFVHFGGMEEWCHLTLNPKARRVCNYHQYWKAP